MQFVAHERDALQIEKQLAAHYPNSAIHRKEGLDPSVDCLPGHDILYEKGYGRTLQLTYPYCFSLKTFNNLDSDPLGVAIAVMENLPKYHWAIVQVLFTPAKHPWGDQLALATRNPYEAKDYFFEDINDRVLRDKFRGKLFAVSVRIAALAQPDFQQLLGWAQQFTSADQELAALTGDVDNCGDFGYSLMSCCTFRPGMLLNLDELASLVHLPGPNIVSERLRRVATRTRKAEPIAEEAGSVVLGDNIHRGKILTARIPSELRARHCYVAGASGTGKSTLLLNMIMQDIQAGCGVGVLDPHGDLVSAVLRRIPAERVRDVILFDPADEEYPFALNILEAKFFQISVSISANSFHPHGMGPRAEIKHPMTPKKTVFARRHLMSSSHAMSSTRLSQSGLVRYRIPPNPNPTIQPANCIFATAVSAVAAPKMHPSPARQVRFHPDLPGDGIVPTLIPAKQLAKPTSTATCQPVPKGSTRVIGLDPTYSYKLTESAASDRSHWSHPTR